jgi:hypothetical protein
VAEFGQFGIVSESLAGSPVGLGVTYEDQLHQMYGT